MLGYLKTGYKNMSELLGLSVSIDHSLKKDIFEFSAYSLLGFLAPFFLSFSQLFLGTVVNISLISSSLYLKGKKILPIIILPSLGVLSRGIIFGPLTIFLMYMIPFIWIGNSILVFSVKLFHIKLNRSYVLSSVFGSFLKAGFLFIITYVLFILGIVPSAFLFLMGAMQLFTAVTASLVLVPVKKIRKKLKI